MFGSGMYGPGMYGLFWELQQERDSSTAKDVARRASRRATDLDAEVKALRAAVNKLILINRALWEIIAEDKKLDEEHLVNKVNEIDLRDGKLDGKMTTAIRQCPSCGRTLFKGHFRCLYCGTEVTDTDPFSSIDTGSDGGTRRLKPL